jgi:hypothetical protein
MVQNNTRYTGGCMKSNRVINENRRKTWPVDSGAWSASATTHSASLRSLFPRAAANLWLDVLLLGALSANVLTAFVNPSLHILSGIMLILIIGIHLFLHWGFWVSVLKGLRQGRLRLLWKWLLNVALLMTFVPTILSGTIVALIYAPNVSGFHRSSVVVFSILVVIHLYTNRKWIARQFNRAGKHV